MILPAKSHIISKMSIGMMLISVCRKTSCLFKNGVSLIACSVGFASLQSQLFVPLHRATALCGCLYASLHSGFVWLTASVHAWTRGGSPSKIAPARMPGVYAQRLYARTHTSGQTKSVQDAPTTNDHDCTDAEPTKHTQPFTTGKGLGVSARMPR